MSRYQIALVVPANTPCLVIVLGEIAARGTIYATLEATQGAFRTV